jgi:hypothetical protein
MYNIDFICTYPYYDKEIAEYCPKKVDSEFIKENIDNDSLEMEEIANCMYQANFLQSFNLTDYNDEIIIKETKRIYILALENSKFKECMKKMANNYLSEDLYVGFMFLFSYDYFFLTHTCICELLKTNKIPSIKILEEYIGIKSKK